MPRVATFCPRCGESIDTQLPEEAKAVGRAELVCPACRFRFVIAPTGPPQQESSTSRDEGGGGTAPEADPSDATQEPQDSRPEGPPAPSNPLTEGAPSGQFPEATEVHRARKKPSGALPARLLSAGLLLFFAAALGLFYAIVFSNAPAIFDAALEGPEGSGEVEGIVVTQGRDPIAGADVAVLVDLGEDERPDLDTPVVANTTTDQDGGFFMGGIDPGVKWLRISLEGHRTTFFQTWALSTEEEAPGQPDLGAALWEVVLRPGDESDLVHQTQQVSMLNAMLQVFQVSGWIAYPASVLAAAAGVFILMRRSFALAVTGSVAGILAVGFLVGGLMALIAMILVLTARREFKPMRRAKPTQDSWE